MRLLIQRVKGASVEIGGAAWSRIGAGLLVFVGVGPDDGGEDVEWLAGKLVRLRIFDDEAGVMNRDVVQAGGEVLVVSQFTLLASTRKGTARVTSGPLPSRCRARFTNVSRPVWPSCRGVPWLRDASGPTCRSRW